MRALAVVLVLLLVVAFVLAIVAWVRRHRQSPARWKLREHSNGDSVRLYAACEGEPPLLIETVPLGGEGFKERLYQARAEARGKVIALNARRRAELRA
ncbi:MAG TPA: hypothetical protein VF752_09900 [Thermoleophilaceae bacterium]